MSNVLQSRDGFSSRPAPAPARAQFQAERRLKELVDADSRTAPGSTSRLRPVQQIAIGHGRQDGISAFSIRHSDSHVVSTSRTRTRPRRTDSAIRASRRSASALMTYVRGDRSFLGRGHNKYLPKAQLSSNERHVQTETQQTETQQTKTQQTKTPNKDHNKQRMPRHCAGAFSKME